MAIDNLILEGAVGVLIPEMTVSILFQRRQDSALIKGLRKEISYLRYIFIASGFRKKYTNELL